MGVAVGVAVMLTVGVTLAPGLVDVVGVRV